jgi:hypothetical protein
MRGIIEYFRSDVLPHWRIWLCAFGVSNAWQNCQAEPPPPPPPEVQMVETVAEYALGAWVAYEVLNAN